MSSSDNDSSLLHLTDDEVFRILDIVEKFDPIIVGGQAVNLWVQRYRAQDQEFLDDYPFTSKDIDFYRNEDAAKQLAVELGGRIYLPPIDNFTPNAALVQASLDGRPIEVDFMASVLGVDVSQIERRQVMLETISTQTRRSIRILLLHPLDCVRSRLANINTLQRHDEHSVSQTVAAFAVLARFLDELLNEPKRFRHVQSCLVELHYVIKKSHIGKPSHSRHGLAPEGILSKFQDDERLDHRWREKILRPCRDRIARKIS